MIAVLAGLVALLGVISIFLFINKRTADQKIKKAEEAADEVLKRAKRESESILKEASLQAKDYMLQVRSDFEKETQEKKGELQRLERRFLQKEELLDRRTESLETREADFTKREKQLDQTQKQLSKDIEAYKEKIQETKDRLERISGYTLEQAKQELMDMIEDEAKMDVAKKIKAIEDTFKEEADRKAQKMIALAIQKYSADYVSERVVTTVPLPNEEMKGRIIGREGRNIRAFEAATGVDLIIDDTPEAVILSGFNPLRREVARVALERLVADGRIHPARIEEVVEKATDEINQQVKEAGEQAIFDLGIHNMHPELTRMIGKLKFRTSYGQNMYTHALEVSFLAGAIASELGLNPKVAKRAGLLHDIGKSVDHEVEGPHALIGAELAKKYGESSRIIHAIAAHHEDESPKDILPIIIQAADALSGARPGARREMLENYLKRLEDLEKIATSFQGVEKAYAIQAGREIRVIVQPGKTSDESALMLARDIVKRVENEMSYPGQVKVTVIRETRAVEFAR
ncbi:MAG: ribonuclease Y [Deltaproteobacteria bacterium]|nr:ribonuclease Y [Deltaproteobacteria bacterium]NIS76469.1 ribonuclease Y [Deltaproteobacteria bacterium]